MRDRPILLYLLAASYTGTTLLTYLLSQHEKIATVGELKATRMGDVDQYRCSCGSIITHCDFWAELHKVVAEHGIQFSVADFATVFGSTNPAVNKIIKATVRGPLFESLRSGILFLTPESASRLRHVARRNFVLSQAICGLQNGHIFLDGSKDPARLLHMIRSNLWDVRVILMQRDGRGVANSYRRHEGMTFSAAIDNWLHTMRELGHMRSRIPSDDIFELRYEELCGQPEQMMQSIWSWLDVARLPLRMLQTTSVKSHILGNKMRLSNLSEIRCDDSWKTNLTVAELNLFERKAGQMNRAIGYE